MALQYPESGLFLLQSETIMVEIFDDASKPTPLDEVGRVVVTSLHYLAMPLIRYEIRDYAEPVESCPCGRVLPTIRRVVDRPLTVVEEDPLRAVIQNALGHPFEIHF